MHEFENVLADFNSEDAFLSVEILHLLRIYLDIETEENV